MASTGKKSPSVSWLDMIDENKRETQLTPEEEAQLIADYTKEKVEKGFRFLKPSSRCSHTHHSGDGGESIKTSPKRIRRLVRKEQTNTLDEPVKPPLINIECASPREEKKEDKILVTPKSISTHVRPWSSGGERRRTDKKKSPKQRPKSAHPARGDELVRPWSVTELVDDKALVLKGETQVDETISQTIVQDDEYVPSSEAKWVWSPDTPSDLQDEESNSEETSPARKVQSFQEWLEGPSVNDEDYDTDLEDDFPKPPELEYDPSGKNIYLQECEKQGVIPVSYIIRHLRDTEVCMRHHYLGKKGTKPLAQAIRDNTFIEVLDLADNHLEPEGAVAIATMLKENCFIVKLDISENTVGAIGAGAISSMLEINYTLKTLILRSTHLKDSDAQLLSSALKNNSTLLELDLCHNDLGDLAGMYLASGLAENNSLAKLNLSWNAIRGKGSVALFNALKANSILEILDLSWNGISLPGCQALGRALKVNTTLRILDMSNNHITPEAAKKLVIGLKKNIGLEAFLVGMNPLGEEGIMTLLVPLYKHSTLRIFSLQGLTVSTGIQAKIEDLMDIKDLYILHSGVGGYRRQRISCSTISMVEQFINENQLHALDGFTQRDLDRTGYISFGDVLEVLYELGLKISEEQVKKIQTHVMLQRRSKVNYRALIGGFSCLKSGIHSEPEPAEY